MIPMNQQECYTHEGMLLRYEPIGEGYGMTQFSPAANSNRFMGEAGAPNFNLAVAGDSSWAQRPDKAKLLKKSRVGNALVFDYQIDAHQLSVTVSLTFVEGCRVVRQVNTVKNLGDSPVTLTHFSSANLMGVATDGLLPWYDANKVRVHYCVNTGQGEGQWRCAGLEELGLYPSSVHQVHSSVHVASVGSFSTGRYFPAAMVEDLETGQIWYFQIESSSGWHYEIGHRKKDDGLPGALFIAADCADETSQGWFKHLAPGESFEAMPVAFGCALGGFEEAVRDLTRYRRQVLKPANAWRGELPVMFNDYMNCLWGLPTREALLPLIDAAREVGADGFCIDAGWYAPRSEGWGHGIGDWFAAEDRFGKPGLQGVLDYIKEKGLIPGLWLELDACVRSSALYAKPDNWFLLRHGKRIGGDRAFLDFRNPDVRHHLRGVIDRLVGMGVGYFKNDYNQSTGSGDDKAGNAPADGLIENVKAFYAFIDETRARHPGLILESCSGGAMRQDYGLLQHFHLQSTSDQEQYYRYPAIINGTLANLLPEQAGVWAYPNPCLFLDMKAKTEAFKGEQRKARMADGEETIFNLVNALCGTLYLSGRIECLDDLNKALLMEGVRACKRERAFVRTAYPVWPLGICRMNDTGYAAQGLISPDGKRLVLAVWRLATAEPTIQIDLSKWLTAASQVKLLYPADRGGVTFSYHGANQSLTVRFDQPFAARCFDITVL